MPITLAKFDKFLGPYEPLQRDGNCGEIISWGHRITGHLGFRSITFGSTTFIAKQLRRPK